MVKEKIGDSVIDTYIACMKQKIKKFKKSNPFAKDLRTPKYKKRTVKNKKIYNRKKKN